MLSTINDLGPWLKDTRKDFNNLKELLIVSNNKLENIFNQIKNNYFIESFAKNGETIVLDNNLKIHKSTNALLIKILKIIPSQNVDLKLEVNSESTIFKKPVFNIPMGYDCKLKFFIEKKDFSFECNVPVVIHYRISTV